MEGSSLVVRGRWLDVGVYRLVKVEEADEVGGGGWGS